MYTEVVIGLLECHSRECTYGTWGAVPRKTQKKTSVLPKQRLMKPIEPNLQFTFYMTNLEKTPYLTRDSEHQNQKVQHLDLSSCPYLTETLYANIYVKQFGNKEGGMNMRISCKDYSLLKPPLNLGERTHKNGMSNKTKSRIKTSIRVIGDLADLVKINKAFITLTYGKYFPKDKTSKTHLDTFNKCFMRHVKKKNEALVSVWVAERQKRGAIHYHIFSLNFIDKDFLNKTWNRIVEKWHLTEGFPLQTVYPNVQFVSRPANYMAKWLSFSYFF